MGKAGSPEVEIKLALKSAEQGRRLLRKAGFRVVIRRHHEDNAVFDHPRGYFRSRGILIRLRRTGKQATLTYKRPMKSAKHKVRMEVESSVPHPELLEETLESLGLRVVFRYEKFRTVYQREDEPGYATLDETPIGVYLELEGPPDWIDATSARLGFSERDYITQSYAELFHRSRLKSSTRKHMLFPRGGRLARP